MPQIRLYPPQSAVLILFPCLTCCSAFCSLLCTPCPIYYSAFCSLLSGAALLVCSLICWVPQNRLPEPLVALVCRLATPGLEGAEPTHWDPLTEALQMCA